MSERLKASELSKAELIEMIARLRGELYDLVGQDPLCDLEDAKEVLKITAFDNDLPEVPKGGGFVEIKPLYPVTQLEQCIHCLDLEGAIVCSYCGKGGKA